MMDPRYHFNRIYDLVNEYKPSRERSLVLTKLEEAELWLTKCEITEEAKNRDQSND